MTARTFWDRLPRYIQQQLLTEHRVKSGPAKATLQLQGALADHVLVIRSGHALETRTTITNQRAVIRLLGPGDAIGLHVLSGHPQRALVRGVSRSGHSVLTIPQSRMRQLAEEHPEVSAAILRTMDDLYTHGGLRLALALSTEVGADQRLAAHLVELATRFGRSLGSGAIIDVGLTQQDLGLYAGVTRARVNRSLSRFRAHGLIADNWLHVTDLHGLRRIAEPYDNLWSVTESAPTLAPTLLNLESPTPLPPGMSWPRPAHLPADIRHFAGRQSELSRLREALVTTPGPRIAVLHGPSGSGKSALAARFGHLFADHFADCRIMVEVRDHAIATVLGAILRALGLPGETVPRSEGELTELYRGLVFGRNVLLILDDVERADQVMRLLPRTASCAVIVTTRRRLTGLNGAHIMLGPLAGPDAVALVGSIAPTASESTRAALAQMCEHHPLAISVAAAGLNERNLSGQDGPQSAFMLGYRNLPAEHRMLFRFVSLSAGPDFSVAALAALADLPVERVLELLGDLEQANLVTASGPHRYRIHDLLREFALDRVQLENNEDHRTAAVGRILDHYLTSARRHSDALASGHRPLSASACSRNAVLEWFERERFCLVAAVRQAAETGRHSVAYGLARACFDFLELRRYGRNNIEIHKIGLRSAQILGDQESIAHMLRHLAVVQQALGANIEAIAYAWMAGQIFSTLGDQHGMALVEENLASVYEVLDRYAEALNSATTARMLHKATGDRRGEAAALIVMADVQRKQGLLEPPLQQAEEALRICKALGDRRGEALALRARARILFEKQDWAETQRDAHRALALCREIHDTYGESWAYIWLARASLQLGEIVEGRQYARKGLDLCRAGADRYGEGWARTWLGELLLCTPDLDGALRQFDAALMLHIELDHPSGQAAARTGIAIVLLHRGRLHEARTHLEQALSLARQIGDRFDEARTMGQLAVALRRLHQLHDAQIFAEGALTAWRALGNRRGMAASLGGLARIHLRAGRYEEALRRCAESQEIRATLNDTAGLGRIADARARVLNRMGRPLEALEEINSALTLLRTSGAPFYLAEASRVRANILLTLGRVDDAVLQAEDALTRARELGAGHIEAAALTVLGLVEQRRGRHETAIKLLSEADLLFVNVTAHRNRIRVLEAQLDSLEPLDDQLGLRRCRRQIRELNQWLAMPGAPGG
jgi:CRP-like cAMP-binding protein/tetratricopeptide (TPR) repeat protein